jgi:hypothetical protein
MSLKTNCVSEEKKVTKLRPFYYVVSLELVGNMPNFIFPVLFTSQCALESGRDIFTLLPRKCKLIIQMDDFLNINQYSMWPKVLPHVKNPYIINQNHIFSIIVKSFLDRF